MKPRLLFCAFLLALAGCDTAPPAHYPATEPSHVKVFLRYPNVPYEKLGLVRYVGTYLPGQSRAAMAEAGGGKEATNALREKGAALGADAVVITAESVTDPNSGDTGENSTMWLEGQAIRFTAPGQPAPSAK